jgi:Zn-dependent peptidase ImmA (M78 family)
MPNAQNVAPEDRAHELLKKNAIRSFPVPVEKIAKSIGAQINYRPLDDELSGMIYVNKGVPIIGVNALHHPNRQRFTIAHEIGHFVLHHNLIVAQVHVDKQFPVLLRNGISSTGTNSEEIEANRFAAELLMPRFLLKAILKKPLDIDDEGPIAELAQKFKVSKQALEYRIRNFQ